MFVLFCPAASAFELRTLDDGTQVRWPAFPVSYQLAERSGDDTDRALRRSFTTWEHTGGVEVGFTPEPGGVAHPKVAADDVNVVWFVDDWPFHDEGVLALASVWADTSGAIVAFDVQIDGAVDWSTDGDPDAYDLQAAITHEVGHVLGIEHSPYEEATMFASQGLGDGWRQALAPDDEDAARFLYPGAPFGQGTKGERPSTHGLGSLLSGSGRCDHAPALGPAFLLVLPFLRRRRQP